MDEDWNEYCQWYDEQYFLMEEEYLQEVENVQDEK